MSPRLLFRVDGGESVGLGHLQRSLSLAAAARMHGAESLFLVNPDPIARTRVTDAGWPCIATTSASWTEEDLDRTLDLARANAATAVIVDSDLDPPSFLGTIRERGFFTCAIEDNGSDDVRAHVLLNGDAHALEQKYRAPAGGTNWLLGPEFALLRPGLADGVATAAVPARRALLTMGGADPCDLMPSFVRGLRDRALGLDWEVVVGPFMTLRRETSEALAALGSRCVVTHAPATLRDAIGRADIVLTAAGQTLYETAALGRPAVAIAVASNQEPQLRAFVRAGSVLDAGDARGSVPAALALIAALAVDPERLAAMAAAGRRCIDGRGADRAARRLLEEAAKVEAENA